MPITEKRTQPFIQGRLLCSAFVSNDNSAKQMVVDRIVAHLVLTRTSDAHVLLHSKSDKMKNNEVAHKITP